MPGRSLTEPGSVYQCAMQTQVPAYLASCSSASARTTAIRPGAWESAQKERARPQQALGTPCTACC
eukprot:9214853-Alexandrium_andersonii.AAC.1